MVDVVDVVEREEGRRRMDWREEWGGRGRVWGRKGLGWEWI